MFDPSQQLHDYFIQQGCSELEAYRNASRVAGRCPVAWLKPCFPSTEKQLAYYKTGNPRSFEEWLAKAN